MRMILKTTILSIFILTLATIARPQDGEAKTLTGILNDNKINGAWQINYAESDNPVEKMQTMLQSKNRQSANEKTADKTNDLPTISVSLVPPETLIFVGGDETSMTINEGFNEIVFTRTIAVDGIMRTGELSSSASFSVMAEQNADSLKIETQSPRKNRMIETYTLTDKGKKLIATIRFEAADAKEIVTFRRVYDRASPENFLPENQEFQ